MFYSSSYNEAHPTVTMCELNIGIILAGPYNRGLQASMAMVEVTLEQMKMGTMQLSFYT